MRLLSLLIVILFTLGCQRAVYINVQGTNKTATKPSADAVVQQNYYEDDNDENTWQHFFLYGWVPGEKVIYASEKCKGPENIISIKTKRTFAEGLVAAFAGYYINIYSPFDGHVECKKEARVKR